MLIEYPDVDERKRELARLIGVEDRMFVEVEGHARVYAIADEDLDRENDEKTSAVHFVRFNSTTTHAMFTRMTSAQVDIPNPGMRSITGTLTTSRGDLISGDIGCRQLIITATQAELAWMLTFKDIHTSSPNMMP